MSPPPTSSASRSSELLAAPGWEFWIDRGGTFTDVVGRRPDGALVTTKLLSEDPARYADAAVEGMRRLLGVAPGAPLPLERIRAVKLGTTVATNALLERRGEPTVLFITRGFRDQLRIGYQNRPKLFERHIRLPELLYGRVEEVEERLDAGGRVLVPLDEGKARAALRSAHAAGFRAIAIVLMHAYLEPRHEQRLVELAREVGFTQISASHEVSPLVKIVARGDTTVVDAYLSPVLRRYVEQLARELTRGELAVPLYFMKSDGGLSKGERLRGKDAILSGPAGGIVGVVKTALASGIRAIIGFDMGGTSTDVSHFAGDDFTACERNFEALVAGVRLTVPMLAVHTIAAGGGSILHFDGQRYRVGPDSAGAQPGPMAYRHGGPLTVTDCNVLLGRLQAEFFPRVFGPTGAEPLDADAVRRGFEALAQEIGRATGTAPRPEEVASGFLRIAVANMANAIKFISVQRGYDVTRYTLACFGGAGGQHATLVADELGMDRVYIHPLAGVLSAYGMGLADVTRLEERAFGRTLEPSVSAEMHVELERLARAARAGVEGQGVAPEQIAVLLRARLKYAGTDTTLPVDVCDVQGMQRAFEVAYQRRFGFVLEGRPLVVEALSAEAVGKMPLAEGALPHGSSEPAVPVAHVAMYVEGGYRDVPVFHRAALARGGTLHGPAIIAEPLATTVLEPGWAAEVGARGELVLTRAAPRPPRRAAGAAVDPVTLELFDNAFMAIAEQMGVRLANTAHSVNIKERLDFSCALFDAAGGLVANAPHMPVHLGSMGESIRTVIAKNEGRMQPGDVFALNDPYNGGTHLPDVTVVLPVFAPGSARPSFFVAARGHHADIGGITPGSMPPLSRNVEEEGVLLDNFLLVTGGRLRERELRGLLAGARYPARNPDQNLADLRAQIAACEKGRLDLLAMVEAHGLSTVQAYMEHVQANAEESVRRAIAMIEPGAFEYELDDGARIVVTLSVDRVARSAVIDFTGTSPEQASNFNAPPAVVHAAVSYVFRTLIDGDIPMNAGCLRPLRIIIPEGSMLAPRPPAATVAGNVETSQCITDALYGALGVMAASQGTMNNFTFGNARHQYYETVAGGSGAGDGFDGTAAVQTHMTNSRLTDPEVLELRFPVLIEEHSIRRGSGGAGRYRGGDGALRRVRFLEPMTAAILAGHRRVPPYGSHGGAPGEVGRTWVERLDGSVRELGPREQVEMDAGDVFVISTPSGGGYGAPQI